MCLYLHTQSNLILTCNEKVEKLTSCSAALLRFMITQYDSKYTACANKSFHLDLNKQIEKKLPLEKDYSDRYVQYVLAGPN